MASQQEKMTAREIAAAVAELDEIYDECLDHTFKCGGGRQELMFGSITTLARILSKMLKEKKWTH